MGIDQMRGSGKLVSDIFLAGELLREAGLAALARAAAYERQPALAGDGDLASLSEQGEAMYVDAGVDTLRVVLSFLQVARRGTSCRTGRGGSGRRALDTKSAPAWSARLLRDRVIPPDNRSTDVSLSELSALLGASSLPLSLAESTIGMSVKPDPLS